MGHHGRGQLITLFLVLVACTVLPLVARNEEDRAIPEEAYRVYSAVLDSTQRVLIASETVKPALDESVVRRLYTSPALIEDFERRNAQPHPLEPHFQLRGAYDLVPGSLDSSQAPYFQLSAVGFNAARTDALLTVNELALTLHRDPGGTWTIQKAVPLTDLTRPASAP